MRGSEPRPQEALQLSLSPSWNSETTMLWKSSGSEMKIRQEETATASTDHQLPPSVTEASIAAVSASVSTLASLS